MKKLFKIYVYGSCHFLEYLDSDEAVGNGGFGIVITSNSERLEEISGGFSNTTNARMEIIGITEGIRSIKESSDITVYSINGYVIDTLSKGWLAKWKKNGYVNKKHADLWKILESVLHESSHSIVFKHAKEIKNTSDFQYAMQLAKTMSSKKNLTVDLGKSENINTDLFDLTQEHLSDKKYMELGVDEPFLEGICVDASCIENPGKMEYRGVDMLTKEVIFKMKYEEATNNIGEFLAIVHALALYKKNGKELKIVYSDSLNAISWVNQKKCKTKLKINEKNAVVFEHIQRAVGWLENNEYEAKVVKWNTAAWGEIPADFGRK